MLYYYILFFYFLNIGECSPFSDALLSYLNLTEEDVTKNFREDIIVSPTGYGTKESVIIFGYFIYGILYFPNYSEYFNKYAYTDCSLCIYYKKTNSFENVIISHSMDAMPLISINITIYPNDNWVCTLLPWIITRNLQVTGIDTSFTLNPDRFIDFNNTPFLELYLENSDDINKRIYTRHERYCDNCMYTLKGSKVRTHDMLMLYSNRTKRQDMAVDPELFKHDMYTYNKQPPRILTSEQYNSLKEEDKNKLPVPNFEECSLRYKYIKFRDLGCNWILKPKSLIFTYCKGICILSTFTKSSVIYGAMVTNDMKKDIHICCAPLTRSNLTIMYMVGKEVRTSEIKDFLPSSCGC